MCLYNFKLIVVSPGSCGAGCLTALRRNALPQVVGERCLWQVESWVSGPAVSLAFLREPRPQHTLSCWVCVQAARKKTLARSQPLGNKQLSVIVIQDCFQLLPFPTETISD